MGSSRDYSDPKYTAWRKRVFRRDRWRCRMPGCAGTERRLNAHHIKRWASHPELRYVVANGLSLCLTCHERVTGREEEFEATFSALAAPAGGDFRLSILMGRHARPQN